MIDLDEHFERLGRPYDPVKFPPPPPWPKGRDPRTPECLHPWNNYWGKKGERQRICRHCGRYVWETQIAATPASAEPDGPAHSDFGNAS